MCWSRTLARASPHTLPRPMPSLVAAPCLPRPAASLVSAPDLLRLAPTLVPAPTSLAPCLRSCLTPALPRPTPSLVLAPAPRFYYTVRELSNHAAELWALRSLGTEVLAGGTRRNEATQGGTSWLVEHLHSDFAKCWQNPLSTGEFDSAICDTGVSRWTNFYIEGLNISTAAPPHVSGVYYDGINFPRETMLRIRRVLSANVGNDALIDLHQSNGSQTGPALSYMMFMPFIDSLWFGESFRYDSPADQFLIEISGLAFGLFGDMLGHESHGCHAVGHPTPNVFRGMLYGMSDRYPSTNVSTPVWHLWDTFSISEASMIGWWDENPPVRSNHPDVRVTSYVKKGNATLLAIGSWAPTNLTVVFQVDWAALGLQAATAKIEAPLMEGVQGHASFQAGAASVTVPVEAAAGWLLIVS